MYDSELFLDRVKLPEKLTKEEFIDLFERMNKGDESAKKKIIEHNIRLVLYRVEKKFKNVDYDKNEFVSIGIFGLIKAIENFDITKNTEFATFACRCIDNEILMFLRKLKKDVNVESLDDVVNIDKDGNELKIDNLLKDENINIEEEIIEKEERKKQYETLHKIVDELNERDKEIIIMYFGLYGNKTYTHNEIAQKLGFERSTITRRIKKILNDMKYMLDNNNINLESKKIQKIVNTKKQLSKDKLLADFPGYSKEKILQAANKLSDRQKEVFYLVYGLEDGKPLKYNEIMKKLNLTYKNTTQHFYNAKKVVIENLSNVKKEETSRKYTKAEIVKDENVNFEDTVEETETDKHSINGKDNIVYKDNDEQTETRPIYKDADNDVEIKFIPKEFNIPALNNFNENRENFRVLINLLSNPTQQVILLLSLGYVEDKYYTVEEISKLLGFEKEKVIDILSDGLSSITDFSSITINGVESARKQLRIQF